MNKKITMPELVDILAQKQNCTAREAETFLKELMSVMADTISSGEILRINGLGVFKPVWVEERSSVNVQTGEPYLIPGHYKLTFTPAKSVRDAINEPFACFSVEELPDDAPLLSGGDIVDELGDDVDSQESIVPATADTDAGQCDVSYTTPQSEVSQSEVSQSEMPQPVESQHVPLSDSIPATPAPIQENETAHSIENTPPTADNRAEECVEEDTPVVSHDEAHIEPAIASSLPDTSQDAVNDNVKKLSKAYQKGVWIGVTATLAILVTVVAVVFFCFPQNIAQLWNETTGRDVAYVDTASVAKPDDTLIPLSPDTILSDSVLPVYKSEVSVVQVVTDTIRRGVFLTNISYKYYGHKAFWVYIYEENSHIISNPDNVPVGTVITIPAAEKYGIDANDTTAINVALEKANIIKQRINSPI